MKKPYQNKPQDKISVEVSLKKNTVFNYLYLTNPNREGQKFFSGDEISLVSNARQQNKTMKFFFNKRKCLRS